MQLNAAYLKARILIYEKVRPLILGWTRAQIAKRIRVLRYPLDYNLIIGPTNICNARCVFCPYPQVDDRGGFSKGLMSFDLFRQIADQWKDDGGQPEIGFSTLAGEPLVDAGLPQKIAYASSIGFNTSIVSNGILLNKNQTWKALLESGLKRACFSFCIPGPEVYRQTFGVDRYEQALSGIVNFLVGNREIGEPCDVTIALRSPWPLDEIMGHRDYLAHIKPYLSRNVRVDPLLAYDNWSGQITESHLSGVMTLRKVPKFYYVPCHALRTLLIRYDGLVRACACRYKINDIDEMIVGRFPDQTLRQIAEGMEFKALYDGFFSGNLTEVCKTCTFYNPIHRKGRLYISIV